MKVTGEMGLSMDILDVVVGTPICRRTAYALDKFLVNQYEIQEVYPTCKLVLATDEPDLVDELEKKIAIHQLKGEVLNYEVTKPSYARSRMWSIACGREALRQYVLSRAAEYLLFLDGDMLFEPLAIDIMKDKIQGFDVVSSGYRLPPKGVWGFGAGCLMLNRKALESIGFRCYEFKNGEVINEDTVLDMDLFSCRVRVNKGIFVSIKHYINSREYFAVDPQSLGWFRTITNSLLMRYIITRISVMTRYHIAHKLQSLLTRTSKVELKS